MSCAKPLTVTLRKALICPKTSFAACEKVHVWVPALYVFCCCDSGYMLPEKSEVGLPSVASMMKLFWHDRLIGVEPPAKYCLAVCMLPANGVNTAEFLISGPYGVSEANSASILARG